MNNVNDAILNLIHAKDYEAVCMGEQIWWHKGKYVREVMERGMDRAEAEECIIKFCNKVAEDANAGKRFTLPYYRDEVVDMMAGFRCAMGMAA